MFMLALAFVVDVDVVVGVAMDGIVNDETMALQVDIAADAAVNVSFAV